MRRGSVPTVAHTLRVHRLANQPIKRPVNRTPLPVTRRLSRNFAPAYAHSDDSSVRTPTDRLPDLECLFTWDKSKSRPITMRTRSWRHSSQRCPTGIEHCQRGCWEMLRHPQAVKCSLRYVGSEHFLLQSTQR